MLHESLRLLRNVAIAVGAFLCFFAVIEAVRAYDTLRGIHPVAGYGFLALLGLVGVWVAGGLVVSVAVHPAAIKAPDHINRRNAARKDVCRYGKYLAKYLKRLAANANLCIEDQESATEMLVKLKKTLGSTSDTNEMIRAIEAIETKTIAPLLMKLEEKADRQVRDCVRDVMVGVALSPYKALDLFVVVFRSLRMVTRVVRIYVTRPRFRELCSIFWDVITIVATVNLVNFGSQFLGRLVKGLPVIGRLADAVAGPIAQGVGAGIMTSVAGHAAIGRCKAFRGWNQEEARAGIRRHLKEYFTDLKGIVKDLMKSLKSRASEEEQDRWEGEVIPSVLATMDEMDMSEFGPKPTHTGPAGDLGGGPGVFMRMGSSAKRGVGGTTKLAGRAGGQLKLAGKATISRAARAGSSVWRYSSRAGRAAVSLFRWKDRD